MSTAKRPLSCTSGERPPTRWATGQSPESRKRIWLVTLTNIEYWKKDEVSSVIAAYETLQDANWSLANFRPKDEDYESYRRGIDSHGRATLDCVEAEGDRAEYRISEIQLTTRGSVPEPVDDSDSDSDGGDLED